MDLIVNRFYKKDLKALKIAVAGPVIVLIQYQICDPAARDEHVTSAPVGLIPDPGLNEHKG